MRLYLFSPYCILRPSTNRIFDMRLCDAFAGQNADVTIVYPYTYMADNIRKEEVPASYGLKNQVKTKMLWTPLREHSGKFTRFLFMNLAFMRIVLLLFFRQLFAKEKAAIFSRDTRSLLPALFLRKLTGRLFRVKIIFMAAEVKNNAQYRFVLRHADGIFAGVTATREAIRKIVPVPPERFILSLAPVPTYTGQITKEEARKRIGYLDRRPLVVYTGKLGLDVREVVYILDAARLLPDYTFLFTGGRASVVNKVKEYCKGKGITNTIFTGFFNDSTSIRNYQLAADVLVSYYTSGDHLVEFNYPQKINEYLSTGNPVVTPDFPATRDVLNEENVFFVAPDDPVALSKGIRAIMEDPERAAKIAARAAKDIQKLTFESRAVEWLDFVRQLP